MNIDELLNYINDNLKENLNLAVMSDMVNYSPRQLYYLLKEITGMPIMSYIRQKRLLAAAKEITDGRRMYDVAMDYSFDTQAGFYKAFLQLIGCSPSTYKLHEVRGKTHQNLPILNQICMEKYCMDKVIIRQIIQSDANDIWENIYSRNTPVEVEERIKDSLKKISMGMHFQFVAEINGHVIGTIVLTKEQHPLRQHTANLYDVIVTPAFQRRGIAKKLFQECLECAKINEITVIKVTCRGGTAAEKVYNKLGFIEAGRIPNGIIEPWGNKKCFDEVMLYLEV